MISVRTIAFSLKTSFQCLKMTPNSLIDQHLNAFCSCSITRTGRPCIETKSQINFIRLTNARRVSTTTSENVRSKCTEPESTASSIGLAKIPSTNESKPMDRSDTSRTSDLQIIKNNKYDDLEAITSSDLSIIKKSETDVLESCEEDVSDIAPFIMPSYNLAAYANRSETLQELIKMGVDLHRVEKVKGAGELILKLDFEKDMKMHLRFLHDNGLPADEFGHFVTKNPFIFAQSLEDLEVRINYLEAKRFSKEQITSVIFKNPLWLNYSTIEIDKRLGFVQRTFFLSGDEVRQVASKQPKLITHNPSEILKSLVAVKEDMGFEELEVKTLLINKPKLFLIKPSELKERFDYVHNIMEIPHERILQQPIILTFRPHIIRQRHKFLKRLGKVQFDPQLPGYVSLDALSTGTDVEFCRNVAKTSIEVFNAYLKTL